MRAVKKRKPITYFEALRDYKDKLFVHNSRELRAILETIQEDYPHLPLDYLKGIANHFFLCFGYEFATSLDPKTDEELKTSVEIIGRIVVDNEVFYSSENNVSSSLGAISLLNVGDESLLKGIFSRNSGSDFRPLPPVEDVQEYQAVAHVIVKEMTVRSLTYLHNFLVTQPTLTASQQALVDTLEHVIALCNNTSPIPSPTLSTTTSSPS